MGNRGGDRAGEREAGGGGGAGADAADEGDGRRFDSDRAAGGGGDASLLPAGVARLALVTLERAVVSAVKAMLSGRATWELGGF
ncbi:unnamed protein product [Lampetra planeri]